MIHNSVYFRRSEVITDSIINAEWRAILKRVARHLFFMDFLVCYYGTTFTMEIQNCDIIPKGQTPLTNIVETKDVLSSGISLTCIRTI